MILESFAIVAVLGALLVAQKVGQRSKKGGARQRGAAALPAPDPRSDALRDLKHRLSRLQYEAGIEAPAEQAGVQLQKASELYRVFRNTLGEKLDPSEITFTRYDSAALQVRDLVTGNLGTLAGILESLLAARATAPSEEAARLLADNEKALAELERVSASIREIHTTREQPVAELGGLLDELEELAKRAKKYSAQ
jgi:hypothetical protein